MKIKDVRLQLQIIALKLERDEHLKSMKQVPEPLVIELENLIRDIRKFKEWK